MFSEDGYVWRQSISMAFFNTINFNDNTTLDVARMERPHIVLNEVGDPLFFSNGVQESWGNDHTYTLVRPIATE